MLKIRPTRDCLIFNIGIPIPGKDVILYWAVALFIKLHGANPACNVSPIMYQSFLFCFITRNSSAWIHGVYSPIFFRVTSLALRQPYPSASEVTLGDTNIIYWRQTTIKWKNKIFGLYCIYILIERFMGPTWGPSGADRTQVGPMLAPWTLLSGYIYIHLISSITVWPIGARSLVDTNVTFSQITWESDFLQMVAALQF